MKKLQFIFAIISIFIISGVSAFGQNRKPQNLKYKTARNAPDLKIGKYTFAKANKKAVRIYVRNAGNSMAGANRLLISVLKIKGTSVNRKKVITVPKLAKGKGVWLWLNAKSILPKSVSLKTTNFRLKVDSTRIVKESNERNNVRIYKAKVREKSLKSKSENLNADAAVDSESSVESLSDDTEDEVDSMETEEESSNESEADSKVNEEESSSDESVDDETEIQDVSDEDSEIAEDAVDDESENLEDDDAEGSDEDPNIEDEESEDETKVDEEKTKAINGLIDNIQVLILPSSKPKKKP